MKQNFKYFLATLILAFCSVSCVEFEEECDEFTEVHRLMEGTENGIPQGNFAFTIQGRSLRNYNPKLIPTLNNFLYWRDLYWYYCKKDKRYYRSDYYYYHPTGFYGRYYENALYYSLLLSGYYREAHHLFLDFDGISNFTVSMAPVDPDSTALTFTLLIISDLDVTDIGNEKVLDSTTADRSFRVEFQNDIFGSLMAGSSLKLTIHNIRPIGQSTLVDLGQSSILFNEAGNSESVSIKGSMNPMRR